MILTLCASLSERLRVHSCHITLLKGFSDCTAVHRYTHLLTFHQAVRLVMPCSWLDCKVAKCSQPTGPLRYNYLIYIVVRVLCSSVIRFFFYATVKCVLFVRCKHREQRSQTWPFRISKYSIYIVALVFGAGSFLRVFRCSIAVVLFTRR